MQVQSWFYWLIAHVNLVLIIIVTVTVIVTVIVIVPGTRPPEPNPVPETGQAGLGWARLCARHLWSSQIAPYRRVFAKEKPLAG